MADSRSGAGKMQDELRTSYSAIKKEEKTRGLGGWGRGGRKRMVGRRGGEGGGRRGITCQRNTGINLREVPVAKAGTIWIMIVWIKE